MFVYLCKMRLQCLFTYTRLYYNVHLPVQGETMYVYMYKVRLHSSVYLYQGGDYKVCLPVQD